MLPNKTGLSTSPIMLSSVKFVTLSFETEVNFNLVFAKIAIDISLISLSDLNVDWWLLARCVTIPTFFLVLLLIRGLEQVGKGVIRKPSILLLGHLPTQ